VNLALDALEMMVKAEPRKRLEALIPALHDVTVGCPAITLIGYCKSKGRLGGIIQHLNDRHLWSRERVADWLDTLDLDLTVGLPLLEECDG
jgi:hypothetical protein